MSLAFFLSRKHPQINDKILTDYAFKTIWKLQCWVEEILDCLKRQHKESAYTQQIHLDVGLCFKELQKYMEHIWVQHCEVISTSRSDHQISMETNRQLSAGSAWMWTSHYGCQINKPCCISAVLLRSFCSIAHFFQYPGNPIPVLIA